MSLPSTVRYFLISQETQVWRIFRKNTRNFYRRIATFMITKLRRKEKNRRKKHISRKTLLGILKPQQISNFLLSTQPKIPKATECKAFS